MYRLLVPQLFFLFFFWAGVLRKWEPFHTYFYLFAWLPYLWLLYQVLRRRQLYYFTRRGNVMALAVFSTTVWLVFEVLNFRLQNWSYHGVPLNPLLRWPGYAISFATVAPGILWQAALFNASVGAPYTPALLTFGNRRRPLFVIGLAMLLLPLMWPRYFFPLVWGAFFFLAEAFLHPNSDASLVAAWRRRDFGRTKALLLAGLVCGLFWEACNFGAGAKWLYHIPFLGFAKLFEMPVLGFIGFLPFALEIHALWAVTEGYWRNPSRTTSRAQVMVLVCALLAFWLLAFWGMDRWTVRA